MIHKPGKKLNILVYGYGNPGRMDDGLGIGLIHHLQEVNLPYIDLEFNYQLQVEDALLISEKDVVIFIDASKENIDCFSFKKAIPHTKINFSTHALSAETVIALSKDLYEKQPAAYLLGIKGYQWELEERLSKEAEINLKKAITFIMELLENPTLNKFEDFVSEKIK